MENGFVPSELTYEYVEKVFQHAPLSGTPHITNTFVFLFTSADIQLFQGALESPAPWAVRQN